MNWMPITEKEQDGKVILTDQGTATYVNQKYWGSPVTNGWYLCTAHGDIPYCTAHGDIPYCADDGMSISSIYPTVWMPFPEL